MQNLNKEITTIHEDTQFIHEARKTNFLWHSFIFDHLDNPGLDKW